MLLFSRSVMSNSLWPHGLQHARLPCPLLSPWVCLNMPIESMMASNHLILCRPLLFLPSIFPSINESESESHSVMSDSLWSHGLYSPWNPPGQNTGVGSLSLLQRIFLTQELNWGLLYCRQILHQLSYQGRSLPASGSLLKSQLFASGDQGLELQLQHQSFQRVFRVDFL